MESVAVIYLLALFVPLAIAAIWFGRDSRRRRLITCPKKDQVVQVEFLCRGPAHRLHAVDVKSCSAFENPHKVKCEKACLGLPVAFTRRVSKTTPAIKTS